MLTIHSFTLGDYCTNCYIIRDSGSTSCCVIDPGYEPEIVLHYLRSQHLTLEAILLTHGHFDHVGGVRTLAAETDCQVYVHEAELSLPPMLTAGPIPYTHTYKDGDTLRLAGLEIAVLHTPGHTPGCVCLLCQDTMFSGDTLFAGSCGRTDLPGGDWLTIRRSLQRLGSLQKNYTVLPGHGEGSTLNQEKQTNPYI